jgi:hypothetical protein
MSVRSMNLKGSCHLNISSNLLLCWDYYLLLRLTYVYFIELLVIIMHNTKQKFKAG